MATAIDMSIYTTATPVETVNVAEFRNRIEHLERLVNADFGACVNAAERANWAASARRIGSELIHTTCIRATVADWNRRERIIDRSTTLLMKLEA